MSITEQTGQTWDVRCEWKLSWAPLSPHHPLIPPRQAARTNSWQAGKYAKEQVKHAHCEAHSLTQVQATVAATQRVEGVRAARLAALGERAMGLVADGAGRAQPLRPQILQPCHCCTGGATHKESLGVPQRVHLQQERQGRGRDAAGHSKPAQRSVGPKSQPGTASAGR